MQEGLPIHYAEMTTDSLYVTASRFGTDAYEAAGAPLPEDLDDYSTRDGVRQNLPENAEFTRDKHDNLFVKYTKDGKTNIAEWCFLQIACISQAKWVY